MRYNFRIFSSYFPLILLAALIPIFALAHSEKVHGEHRSKKEKQNNEAIKLASNLYIQNVQPIFKKSCFDCHGTASEMPWYYKVPGIKGMIDADMKEAKMHLNMSKGFPFEGHGSVSEDLSAIEKSVSEETMPPRNYQIMHPSSKLSKEEKQIVIKWIKMVRDAIIAQ